LKNPLYVYVDCRSDKNGRVYVIALEKAAVFLDGGFFSKVRLHFGRPELDWVKFCDKICGDNCERLRTYFYDCMPYRDDPPTPEQQKRYADKQRFINSLSILPRFEIRLGRLQRLMTVDGDDFRQKGVDILLAVDLVRMAWRDRIYKAVIVTNDTDFIPAIKEAKDAGVLVHLHYCNDKPFDIHEALYSICDDRTPITRELLLECESSSDK